VLYESTYAIFIEDFDPLANNFFNAIIPLSGFLLNN
jgi:hypothetical protein